jgi:hypothetical protein
LTIQQFSYTCKHIWFDYLEIMHLHIYLLWDIPIDFTNGGLSSALRAFGHGRIFIVPHLLWQGPRYFQSHPKDHPIHSPLTTLKRMWRIYSNPDHQKLEKYRKKEYVCFFKYKFEVFKAFVQLMRFLTISIYKIL